MAKIDPLVSVIVVDYKLNNPLLVECLAAIEKQTYRNFEIILLTDYPVNLRFPKLRKKSYGRYIGPAQKRDDGAVAARGEILAFIDDDAYPSRQWLAKLVRHYSNPQVAAVGGPGMTPPHVPWAEAASGWVSASPFGGGPYTYRFFPAKFMDVDDYPSMNLSVRKSDFAKVGGFDSNYWPGEDTKLCLDLTHMLGKRIIYDPEVLVFHHRRPLWLPHLRQNGNFGIHRGYFVKILPETSARLIYFGPSLMFLGLIYLLSYFLICPINLPIFGAVAHLGIIAFFVYFLVLFINGIWIWQKSGDWSFGLVSVPAIFITHLWYGLRFLQGLLSPVKVENSNQGDSR
jgi:GT2 family glycosyltransferase